MKQSHYLLKGTFLLTAAGLAARIAGFFYKIFLSRTIGAEEIGLYHLCFPVFAFSMAAASGGVQTAISRFTAEYCARGQKQSARKLLLCALTLSLGLSFFCSALLYRNSGLLAERFLLEPRCAMLLRIAAFSLPFGVLHACISGYFIGKKQVSIPAASQLVEQLLRIGSVFFFYALYQRHEKELDATVMMLGQVAGELFSSLFCVCFLAFSGNEGGLLQEKFSSLRSRSPRLLEGIKKTLAVSAPLGVNRMLLCVLQAIEAALLPQQLKIFGHGSSAALTSYGTLTGMALPLLLFPTAITGSISTLLLPLVSEARAQDQNDRITATTRTSFQGGLLLGLFFFSAFFLFGEEMERLLFDSALAGEYIRTLSLLCPFLYINTTVTSILHALGKTTAASIQNTVSFLLRLAAVILLVPGNGMNGYFIGLLFAQSFLTVSTLFLLYRCHALRLSLMDAFLKPVLVCFLTTGSVALLRFYVPFFARGSLLSLFLGGVVCLAVFAALLLCVFRRQFLG